MTPRWRSLVAGLASLLAVAASAPGVAADRSTGALVTIIVDAKHDSIRGLGSAVVDQDAIPALGLERLRVAQGEHRRVLEALSTAGIGAWIDTPVHATRTPDDPGYLAQWAYPTMRTEAAWDRTIGTSDTVVAVIDTGIVAGHPDLDGATVPGWDFVRGDDDPDDEDLRTHGTSVAGVVAARTDNAEGVAGTCWRCRVMPLKVLDGNGNGSGSVVAEAIVYATDHGADVINLSLGGTARDGAMEAAVSYAAQRGVVLVAAAGNAGDTTQVYPAAFEQVIGVAASAKDDSRYPFSTYGSWVSVAAPGCATTTVASAYGDFCGTSASSPFVAGIAGLVRSVRPDLPAADVRRAIEEGAIPVGGWVEHGRVDAANTVPVSPIGTGNLYRSVEPARILDTRTSVGGHQGKLGHRDAMRLEVAGVGGVPASGVAAVVLNVTVTHPTHDSYLTVYPSGTSRPVASNLNYVAGQTIPNLVTVKVGSGGQVDLFNFSGSVHVVVDVAGYYLRGGGGAMFRAITPARILDTRNGTGGVTGPVGDDEAIAVRVAGRGGVPRHGVTAVAVNVTAVDGTRDSYLTVHPAGSPRPAASTVNFGRGDIVPNMALAKLGRDGKIRIYNFAGSVDVVVDVMGYYTLNERGASFHPLSPARAVDTRNGTGGPRVALDHRSTRRVDLSGTAGVPTSGATAVVTNITAVEPTATETYLSIFPAGAPRPTVSNLNAQRGEIFPNLATATLSGAGEVDVYNHSGRTHLIVDVAGYFSGG